MNKKASVGQTKAMLVEVRGVEPRSEEKILRTSTYVAPLLWFAHGNSGRQDWPYAIQGGSHLRQDFIRSPSERKRTIPSQTTFFWFPVGKEHKERVA